MVEDYTNAFLVSALMLCFMGLIAIWVVWGFLAALLVGWTTDRIIAREARRSQHF